MYSCLIKAAIFGAEKYDWLRYNGKTIEIPFRGVTRTLEPGQKIGVRPSTNGKQIRMVFENDLNRVMTLDLPLARKIAKTVKLLKG